MLQATIVRGFALNVPWDSGRITSSGSNRANRGFAGKTVPGHFVRTAPVLVHLARTGSEPVHFAPAGPLLGDFARARSLPVHFARAGRVGVLAWAGTVPGHFG